MGNYELANPSVRSETFNWDELQYYLDNQHIVPILGSGLFQVKSEEDSKQLHLYDYMHCELCKKVEPSKRDEDCWEFMEKNKYIVPTMIKDFMRTIQARLYTPPLIKLAKISDFKYYICLTYDNFFQPILKDERCNKEEDILTIDFSISNNSVSKTYDGDKIKATIYNLMGSISKINGFAKTEEEVLEHLYSLTKENQFTEQFFSDMEEKHFLFIGCNYPNWLLRFLIRIITRERLNNALITKIIADQITANDKKQCMFLNHFNSKIFHVPNFTSIEFVNELYNRWMSRQNKNHEDKIRYTGTVFLSFSCHDREDFVDKLYQRLVLHGVNVFYDRKKLDAGDYFTPKIKKAISDCRLFVPLISENSLNPEKYAILEWSTAMIKEQYFIDSGMKKMEDSSFIKPFIIDDTAPNDSRIQQMFKHISAQRENNIDKIVDHILSNLKK